MKPLITLIIGIAGFFYFQPLKAQIYHFETGKVVPIETSGQIIWKDGIYNSYPARFGTLVVKENREIKNSRLISIPVIYIQALMHDNQGLPVFTLNGGPGESNLDPNLLFEDILIHHPIIMVGYRGVDGSVKLDCPCLLNALLATNLDSVNAPYLYQKAIDSCKVVWQLQNIDLSGYTVRQTAADLEEVRRLMNFDSIAMVSFSFGGMVAQQYLNDYPRRVAKCAYIAPRPYGNFTIKPADIRLFAGQVKQYYNNIFEDEEITDNQGGIFTSYRLLLDSIKEKCPQVNQERFMVYLFSKLYTVKGIQDLHIFLQKGRSGNWEPLTNDYTLFYKTYASKLVIGDILVKKQDFVIENIIEIERHENYSDLLDPVNRWFGMQLGTDNGTISSQPLICTIDSTPSVIICGSLDIVSSPLMVGELMLPRMVNSRMYIVPGVGHLGLFTEHKNQVEEWINSFLKQ
jgi:pimeloyl-ACP methyl ester carboxylesterase